MKFGCLKYSQILHSLNAAKNIYFCTKLVQNCPKMGQRRAQRGVLITLLLFIFLEKNRIQVVVEVNLVKILLQNNLERRHDALFFLIRNPTATFSLTFLMSVLNVCIDNFSLLAYSVSQLRKSVLESYRENFCIVNP